uniref:Uncharacterized protein n=1 Tax=Arion vulgaris TaxID=1028688 RepID=A0A0B7BU00_9EUPU
MRRLCLFQVYVFQPVRSIHDFINVIISGIPNMAPATPSVIVLTVMDANQLTN